MLESVGFSSVGCSSIAEAVALFKKNAKLRILVCDLNLGSEWGLDAIKEIHGAVGDDYLFEVIVLTGYGSAARIARSAVDRLRSQGVKAGLFRPVTLSPFPERELNSACSGKTVLVVEMSNGQYRDDVLLHLERNRPVNIGLVNRMGGNLVKVEAVLDGARKMLEGTA